MIEEAKIYLVDAFTTEAFGGNPAGVCITKEPLDEEVMAKVAREWRLSETAFITPMDRNLYQVRFFTPVAEVDLCGHATIASFYVLAKEGFIHPLHEETVVEQLTKVGRLGVRILAKDGEVEQVWMEQGEAQDFGAYDRRDLLERLLGLSYEEMTVDGTSLTPRLLSTGLKDLFVPVKSRELLDGIVLDPAAAQELYEDAEALSVHVFTTEEGIVHQRNFSPVLGIEEEAATGTSTGALYAWLNKEGLASEDFFAIQGEAMGRPSKIFARQEAGRVVVGGSARILMAGVLHV